MVQPAIDELANSLIDEIGTVIGETLRDVDRQIKDLIARIIDIEVQSKHRNDAISTDVASEIKNIGAVLNELRGRHRCRQRDAATPRELVRRACASML
jgi:hypothetical protein